MNTKLLRAAGFGLLIVASPVLAQTPPPASDGQMQGRMQGHMQGRGEGRMGARMFPTMSEAGRATMMDAMRSSNRRDERVQVRAARDRMLTIVEADRLDTAALKKAMDDERSIAAESQQRRQTAMLAALTKLSVADRKAFVVDARSLREKMQERMSDRRERMRDRRRGGGES